MKPSVDPTRGDLRISRKIFRVCCRQPRGHSSLLPIHQKRCYFDGVADRYLHRVMLSPSSLKFKDGSEHLPPINICHTWALGNPPFIFDPTRRVGSEFHYPQCSEIASAESITFLRSIWLSSKVFVFFCIFLSSVLHDMLRGGRVCASFYAWTLSMIRCLSVVWFWAGRFGVEFSLEWLLQSPSLHFFLVTSFLIRIDGTFGKDIGASTSWE